MPPMRPKGPVEAETPSLRKTAPNKARGASGATGYLLFSKIGEEGVLVGMRFAV